MRMKNLNTKLEKQILQGECKKMFGKSKKKFAPDLSPRKQTIGFGFS